MEAFFNLTLPKSWADLSDRQLLFFFSQLASDKPMAEIQTLCLCKWANVLVRCRLDGNVYYVQCGKQQAVLTLHQFVCAITALDYLKSFPPYPVRIRKISQGYIELNNSPHTRRVKTIFLAMRHALNDMAARQTCMDIMRKLFRQFMSKLILERTKLEQHNIYLDPRISFQEIDQYFFSGCACAYFQIAIDTYTDLRYDPTEWQQTKRIIR